MEKKVIEREIEERCAMKVQGQSKKETEGTWSSRLDEKWEIAGLNLHKLAHEQHAKIIISNFPAAEV